MAVIVSGPLPVLDRVKLWTVLVVPTLWLGKLRVDAESAAMGREAVPLTETCCVLPVTFSVLFVTVIPALRLPPVCGVKFTETSQRVPADSEVDDVHGFVSEVFWEKLDV